MKTIAAVTTFLLLASIAQSQTLTSAQAEAHVGENATVCGIVASGHIAASGRGEPTFINLDSPYPDQVFTILISGGRQEGRRGITAPKVACVRNGSD